MRTVSRDTIDEYMALGNALLILDTGDADSISTVAWLAGRGGIQLIAWPMRIAPRRQAVNDDHGLISTSHREDH